MVVETPLPLRQALEQAAPVSGAVFDQIVGAATSFTDHIDQWRAQREGNSRASDQMQADVKAFAKDVAAAKEVKTLTVQMISKRDVQAWSERQRKDGISHKTIKRKISAIRNYWRYLSSLEAVEEDRPDPFVGVSFPRAPRVDPETKRQAFAPQQIVNLWKSVRKDAPLADLIKIAAYTGGRIESVAGLRVDDIRTDDDTSIRYIKFGDKTMAGYRKVPILPQIAPVLDRLIEAVEDGYLIPTTAANKHGERSAPLGKRFGRAKTDAGFDKRYVFHSIRKSFANMFKAKGISDDVIKDILGHEDDDITTGTYMDRTSLADKLDAMTRCVSYPEFV